MSVTSTAIATVAVLTTTNPATTIVWNHVAKPQKIYVRINTESETPEDCKQMIISLKHLIVVK